MHFLTLAIRFPSAHHGPGARAPRDAAGSATKFQVGGQTHTYRICYVESVMQQGKGGGIAEHGLLWKMYLETAAPGR